MGDLLKARVVTREQAKEKLDADITEARARYRRRLKEIETRETEAKRLRKRGEEPKLPIRARHALKYLLATYKTNGFGRSEIDYWPKDSDLTPAAASKFTASDFLAQPNCGHKAINGLALWLRFHGYELRP